jgi:hypothetical protein
MWTILTGRADGLPSAGLESVHPEGSIRRDDPATVDSEVVWSDFDEKENPVAEATKRIAEATNTERNTTSVCLVNVPGALS